MLTTFVTQVRRALSWSSAPLSELKQLRGEVARLESELARERDRSSQLERSNIQTECRATLLKSELSKNAKHLKDLETERDKNIQAFSEMRRKLQRADQRAESAISECDALKCEIAELKVIKMKAIKTEVDLVDLREKYTALTHQLGAMRDALVGFQERATNALQYYRALVALNPESSKLVNETMDGNAE